MTNPVLSIQLLRDLDTGEWYVERVDAEFKNIRNQTRFVTPHPIRFAFTAGFAQFLEGHLPVRLGPSIVIVDTVQVDGMDLGLNGMRIIAQRALSGLQSVTIRVRDYVGRITDILSPYIIAKLGSAMGVTPQLEQPLGPLPIEARPSRAV